MKLELNFFLCKRRGCFLSLIYCIFRYSTIFWPWKHWQRLTTFLNAGEEGVHYDSHVNFNTLSISNFYVNFDFSCHKYDIIHTIFWGRETWENYLKSWRWLATFYLWQFHSFFNSTLCHNLYVWCHNCDLEKRELRQKCVCVWDTVTRYTEIPWSE